MLRCYRQRENWDLSPATKESNTPDNLNEQEMGSFLQPPKSAGCKHPFIHETHTRLLTCRTVISYICVVLATKFVVILMAAYKTTTQFFIYILSSFCHCSQIKHQSPQLDVSELSHRVRTTVHYEIKTLLQEPDVTHLGGAGKGKAQEGSCRIRGKVTNPSI